MDIDSFFVNESRLLTMYTSDKLVVAGPISLLYGMGWLCSEELTSIPYTASFLV